MDNVHDKAREYLATDGLKLRDAQKNAIFEFADWLYRNDLAIQMQNHEKETQERIAYLEKQLGLAPGANPAVR